jgi:hypothetical protein
MADEAERIEQVEDHVEVKTEYRYGIVLLLLLLTFMVLSSGATGAWVRPLTVALQGGTLLAALYASHSSPRLRTAALVLVAVLFITSLLMLPLENDFPKAGTALLNGLLVALAPVAIVAGILRRRVIDLQTVLGALCIYVLLGMFFAFVYTAIGEFQNAPFFVQEQNATNAEFLYFSYVTLTTVGYGDLTAAGNVGRSVAVLEALFGQVYLVTVVALLVSNMVPRRTRRPELPSSPRGDDDAQSDP